MATAANWQQREDPYRETERTSWRDSTDKYRPRPVPNEDVYFYAKLVDNTRLVRPVNQVARKQEMRVVVVAFAMLLLMIGLALPHLMNVMAGAQIQKLRATQSELIAANEEIELRESEAMNPERIKALAHARNMVEPAPRQIIQLDPQPELVSMEAKLKP